MLTRTIDVQRHARGGNRNTFKIGTVGALLEQQCRAIALRACRLHPMHPIRDLDIGLLRSRITDLELMLHSVLTIRKETNLGDLGRNCQPKEDLFKPIADRHTPIRLNPRNLPTNTSQPNCRRLLHRQSTKLSKKFQGGCQVSQRFLGQTIGCRGCPKRSLGVANVAVLGSRNFCGMKPNDFFGVNRLQHTRALRQWNAC